MKSSELMKKEVVIAPFSTEAIFLYHMLKQDGAEVAAFMDRDASLHNSGYQGTQILPYVHFESKDLIVITAKPGYVEEGVIQKELLYVGYSEEEIVKEEEIEFECDALSVRDLIDLNGLSKIRDQAWIKLLKGKIAKLGAEPFFYVEAMHILLTTRCTLKCKDCVNLMDYYRPKDQYDIDFEKIAKSFDRLMEHVDYVHEILPMGGEPFLYKRIDELLLLLASEKYARKIGEFLIVTNGTIIPKKSTLEILGAHRDRFRIWVTDYKKLSPKKWELFSLLNQYGCDYENHIHESWYLTNQPVTPPPGVTMDEVKEKCDLCDCCNGGRLRLVGERVYPCHFLAFAALCHLIPEDERDYFDMSRDSFTTEELLEFLRGVHPGKAYCGSPWNRDEESCVLIPIGKQLTSPRECTRYE